MKMLEATCIQSFAYGSDIPGHAEALIALRQLRLSIEALRESCPKLADIRRDPSNVCQAIAARPSHTNLTQLPAIFQTARNSNLKKHLQTSWFQVVEYWRKSMTERKILETKFELLRQSYAFWNESEGWQFWAETATPRYIKSHRK